MTRLRLAPEAALQAEIVQMLKNEFDDLTFYSIPNERRASPHERLRLLAMGMRPGVADLEVIGNDGRPIYLECKSPNGRQTAAQREFQLEVEAKSLTYNLVSRREQAIEIVLDLMEKGLLG